MLLKTRQGWVGRCGSKRREGVELAAGHGGSRSPYAWPLAALAFGLMVGCGSDPEVIRHPISDSLSVAPGSAVVVTRAREASGSPELSAFASRIESRSVIWTVGALEGVEDELFGEVHQAEWLGPDTMAILDRQGGVVRTATRSGSAGTIGGPGQGPGEYEFPVSVLSVDGSEVIVVDGSGELQSFRSSDGSFEFSGGRRVEGYPEGACILMDGTIVVHVPSLHDPSVKLPGVLRVVDHAGNVGAPFALPYRYRNWLVADRMNRGRVICSEEETVVLAAASLNGVHAYRANSGELLWHSTFPHIRIPPVRERRLPDGRTSVGVDVRREAHFHLLLGVAGGRGAPLVVQFARRRGQDVVDRIDRYEIETFLLDIRTGEGIYLGESLPRVLSVDRDRIVLLHPDPYPRIEVAALP